MYSFPETINTPLVTPSNKNIPQQVDPKNINSFISLFISVYSLHRNFKLQVHEAYFCSDKSSASL